MPIVANLRYAILPPQFVSLELLLTILQAVFEIESKQLFRNFYQHINKFLINESETIAHAYNTILVIG